MSFKLYNKTMYVFQDVCILLIVRYYSFNCILLYLTIFIIVIYSYHIWFIIIIYCYIVSNLYLFYQILCNKYSSFETNAVFNYISAVLWTLNNCLFLTGCASEQPAGYWILRDIILLLCISFMYFAVYNISNIMDTHGVYELC